MDQQNPKQQLTERLKTANNVLVTVSADPSVDQLAACIGLTLFLNKQGKHATAVFSGDVPSTLEFLKPEETLEKNTDSLRDFIISLDKSKADKLRYKVEDKVVKIFITPYRTSLSADDLEFSQGDFNVDLVVALGVKVQEDLDNAITAHGRILHDATVATVNTSNDGNLGSINWHDNQASSLCELVVDLGHELGKDLLDNQIATALLTGIVAETARFSNEKTTPQTMSVSAELMSAGANQQLVASKLEGPSANLRSSDPTNDTDNQQPEEQSEEPPKPDDGTLEISHRHKSKTRASEPAELEAEKESEPEEVKDDTADANVSDHSIVTEPPRLGGQLTANTEPEGYDPTTDPLSLPAAEEPILSHDSPAASPPEPTPQPLPEAPSTASPPAWTPPAWVPPAPAPVAAAPVAPIQPPVSEPQAPLPNPTNNETLAELEENMHSPHAAAQPGSADLDAARNEVMSALNSAPAPTPPPVEALNAQHVDLGSAPATPSSVPSIAFDPTAFGASDAPTSGTPQEVPAELSNIGPTMTMPLPPTPAASQVPPVQPTVTDPTAPPPVPPPLPFQFDQNKQNQ